MAMRKKKRISKIKNKKQMPCFPKIVYKYLPDFLYECYSSHIYSKNVNSKRSLHTIFCCYEHNKLLLSLMLSPTLHPLNNPYNIQHLIGKLSKAFIHKAAI